MRVRWVSDFSQLLPRQLLVKLYKCASRCVTSWVIFRAKSSRYIPLIPEARRCIIALLKQWAHSELLGLLPKLQTTTLSDRCVNQCSFVDVLCRHDVLTLSPLESHALRGHAGHSHLLVFKGLCYFGFVQPGVWEDLFREEAISLENYGVLVGILHHWAVFGVVMTWIGDCLYRILKPLKLFKRDQS